MIFLFSMLLFLGSCIGTAIAGDNDQKEENVVFLPFNIQVPGPYTYLEEGLASVLASRLTARTEITAVHQNAATRKMRDYLKTEQHEAFTRMLGSLQAQHLIIGTLAPNEEHFELAVLVFSKAEGATPRVFTRSITAIDQSLQAVDELAWDIAEKIFGKQRPGQITATPTEEEKGMTAFQTAHPDRVYKEGIYTGSELGLAAGDQYALQTSRRSRKISVGLKDMDVADLDGDGTREIILAANDELLIYSYSSDHFSKVAAIELDSYLQVHAVNVADINGNGIPEIYVSANNRDHPASTVIEWDGRKATVLYKDVPYYIRPGSRERKKPFLLGQSSSTTGPVGQTIYHLRFTEHNEIVQEEKLLLGKGINLFDFVMADLDGNEIDEIIALDKSNKLLVMDRTGKTLWESSAKYGASKNYFGTLSSSAAANKQKTYVPTRLIARDVDGDGKPEIIIGRNRLASVKFFNRLRYFEGSSISALTWTGSQLAPLWETQKIPGYTVSYQLVMPQDKRAEADGQRTIQLFFAEEQSNYPFVFWQSESCYIHLYQLGRPENP